MNDFNFVLCIYEGRDKLEKSQSFDFNQSGATNSNFVYTFSNFANLVPLSKKDTLFY